MFILFLLFINMVYFAAAGNPEYIGDGACTNDAGAEPSYVLIASDVTDNNDNYNEYANYAYNNLIIPFSEANPELPFPAGASLLYMNSKLMGGSKKASKRFTGPLTTNVMRK